MDNELPNGYVVYNFNEGLDTYPVQAIRKKGFKGFLASRFEVEAIQDCYGPHHGSVLVKKDNIDLIEYFKQNDIPFVVKDNIPSGRGFHFINGIVCCIIMMVCLVVMLSHGLGLI